MYSTEKNFTLCCAIGVVIAWTSAGRASGIDIDSPVKVISVILCPAADTILKLTLICSC